MTREQWLQGAVRELTYLFADPVPPLQVSCGWPSKSATTRKNRRIGECWDASCAADRVHHIFISPLLDSPADVLAALAHEMVHAVVGIKAGHKGPFKRVALGIGLTGKMTATVVGPELAARLATIAEQLGPYPHGALNPSEGAKKQSTRLIKAECEGCGAIIRLTQKVIDSPGLPTCACGAEFQVS